MARRYNGSTVINKLRDLLKNSHGFTLIELLIVIAIIAILTVAFLPGALRAPARARDAGRIKAVADIQAAIEGYIAGRNGTYPTVIAGDGHVAGTTLETALGIGGLYSAPPPINSAYYYYNGGPDFYAVGFVPENTANANSAAVTAWFGPGTGCGGGATCTRALFSLSGSGMYVVTGPI